MVFRVQPEREERLAGDPRPLDVGEKVPVDQGVREHVGAGAERGVGGEDGALPHCIEGFRPTHAAGDGAGQAFQGGERGVTLVQVHSAGADSQLAQGPHAPHSEHDLLAQPLLKIAGVQALGDRAIPRMVLFEVRGEEVQRDPPHPRFPHPNVDRGIKRGHRYDQRVPLAIEGRPNRVARPIEGRVGFLLPTVVAEPLAHVAVGVDEPDPNERKPEVARLLERVAGEDPQAAGVHGERNVDAELCRKVCYRPNVCPGMRRERCWGNLRLLAESGHHLVVQVEEPRILRRAGESAGCEQLQHSHRVVSALAVRLEVERAQEFPRFGIPAPPQVVGEIRHPADPLWQLEIAHVLHCRLDCSSPCARPPDSGCGCGDWTLS